ncbi:MAG TPA: DUF58 domain-containing protein, partial [Actinomycetales bacterium]|nr:DUF58 domain-containing protein [Actinomycetales bacterium]
RVPLNLGADVLSTFADTLAPVFPRLVEVDWPLIAGLTSTQLSQRSLVVLLTALDPAAVESGLLQVATRLARDHQVVVASVADPEIEELRRKRDDVEDVFIASAAERVKLGRIAIGQMLGQVGVEVVEATPDELAPKLADKYLALKAAGKL